MNQIVQYQLSRAVKSSNKTPLKAGVDLRPLFERILGALQKVYRDKHIDTELLLVPQLSYPADERDLMEMLGNLLENAFKYGHSHVRVSAENKGQWLNIEIADDGPGVSPEQRNRILQRGELVNETDTCVTVQPQLTAGDYQLEISSVGADRYRLTVEMP